MKIRKLKIKNSQKGFSIFLAIIITGVLLIVAFSVSYLSSKELSFSGINRDSQYAIFAADAGAECALYWDSKVSPGKFDPGSDGSPITCNNHSMSTNDAIAGTSTVSRIGGGGGFSDVVWVEDSLPPGANTGGDSWNWVGSSPTPYSGSSAALQSDDGGVANQHQYYFTGASPTFHIYPGDNLIAYIYIDPDHLPAEVMLQWHSGGVWDHRAYWGDNSCNSDFGPMVQMSTDLPGPSGQWVRLSVPASNVGLDDQDIDGIAFSLCGGVATWDHAGRSPAGGSIPSVFGFSMDSGNDSNQPCAIVTVEKDGSGGTHIFSRGYNTCDTNSPRRVERGIEVKY